MLETRAALSRSPVCRCSPSRGSTAPVSMRFCERAGSPRRDSRALCDREASSLAVMRSRSVRAVLDALLATDGAARTRTPSHCAFVGAIRDPEATLSGPVEALRLSPTCSTPADGLPVVRKRYVGLHRREQRGGSTRCSMGDARPGDDSPRRGHRRRSRRPVRFDRGARCADQ